MDKPNTSDFTGLADWVEIFKAGTQTDSRGRTREFTTDDLDSMVANHDAAHPPRHVITHKELYSPFGYGDLTELKRERDSLFARSDNIEPQFEALVQNGRLPERSVRIRPAGDGWRVEHLAWLGAEPPAVEGLAPVQFSAADDALDFAMRGDWYTPNVLARMMRRMRDFLVEQFGKEKADGVMPDYELESITEHAAEVRSSDTPEASFNAPEGGTEVTTFTQEQLDEAKRQAREEAERDFAAKQAEKDKAQAAELAKERRERSLLEYRREVEGWLDDGRMVPAMAAGAAEFMASLDDGDGHEFDFSVGDGDDKKNVKTGRVKWFRDFMAALPQHKLGDEVGGGDDLEAGNADFSVPHGATVNPDRLALHQKALDYQAKHEGVDYLTAVQAVEKAGA